MIHLPVLRWGKPYRSLETTELVHFETGEPIATVSSAHAGLVLRDMRQADAARKRLLDFSCDELIQKMEQVADAFENGTLKVGDDDQTPQRFVRCQSATTGLPETMCWANMQKNGFVLRNMGTILDALTRGLPLEILSRGHGVESRGVRVSYQAQSPVLGAVLPSNSPGVHTLWLPAIALQIGLVLKPGSQEPWTAYRMAAAFSDAGIPPEALSLYPGGHDVGEAIVSQSPRSMIFGSQKTIDQYAGNRRVQVHGPGYSKIFLGDDRVDDWEQYLDLMVESVFRNGGRSCINASSIWASRHTEEIAQAIAERIGSVEVRPPDHPDAQLAAFTRPDAGRAILEMIERDLQDARVRHYTGPLEERLVEKEHCSYLRPIVVHTDHPECEIVKKEFMFPFVSVVRCPQDQMIRAAGPTLVASVITQQSDWSNAWLAATHVDRLNRGPLATTQIEWRQPHEGNLIDFLFRSRAVQWVSDE